MNLSDTFHKTVGAIPEIEAVNPSKFALSICSPHFDGGLWAIRGVDFIVCEWYKKASCFAGFIFIPFADTTS